MAPPATRTLPLRSTAPLNALQLHGPFSWVNWPVEGSYSAAKEYEALPLAKLLLTKTSPFRSSAVTTLRLIMPALPVALQVPVEGLYSSEGTLLLSPMASTSPSRKSAAVVPPTALVGLPVADQVPVAGLYNSALVPCAANTLPLGSRVRLNP